MSASLSASESAEPQVKQVKQCPRECVGASGSVIVLTVAVFVFCILAAYWVGRVHQRRIESATRQQNAERTAAQIPTATASAPKKQATKPNIHRSEQMQIA